MFILDGKLTDQYFEIAGHLVRIRVEPPEFRQKLKEISDLINNKDYDKVKNILNSLPLEWQQDEEFIRIMTFIHFMEE